MKIRMQRGLSAVAFTRQFDSERPVIQFEHDYLWIGGEHGPCYATLSGPKTLRKLAQLIMRKTRPQKKK